MQSYEWYVNNMRLLNIHANYGKNIYMTTSLNGMVVQEAFFS